jgi:sterol desaturase/sphingolipid hydroxylase (fatty acid hydroxylase superfamily)
VVVVILWLPVALLFMALAVVQHTPGASWAYVPIAFIIGVLVWTLTEYLVHRFVFHFQPSSPEMERIFFLFHGVHHAQPQDKTRLVMPLPVSIPMAVLFYGLYTLIFAVLLRAPQWVNPVMGGFLIGYLVYDLTHYATHHFPMRSRLAKLLKRHHMMHHYKDENTRFGVSSPLWDLVFRTMGAGQQATPAE